MYRDLIACLTALLPALALRSQDTSFTTYQQSIPNTAVSFTMVPIPGGSFHMGSPEKEKGHLSDEGPAINITLDSFWMEEHEVTYEEYILFQDEAMDKPPVPDGITRPSPPYIDFTLGMGKTGGFPANSMSQYAAIMYCKWLYKKTGVFYRLPTEAEWEYACRAGSAAAYPYGDTEAALRDYAWYEANSGGKYHPVKQLKPNALGLYDMLGNVAEWTLDQYYSDYFEKVSRQAINPVMPPVHKYPVTLRGGSYRDAADKMRSAARLASDRKWNARDPQIPRSKWWNTDAPFIGFRLVRPFRQPNAAAIDQFFTTYLAIP